MTRFARAKGSKASNERLPENSTPWNVMKKQLINKQVEKEFMKGKKQFDEQRQTKYDEFLKKSQTVKSEWCEFKEENDNGKIKEGKKNIKKKTDDENMNEDIEADINQFCEEKEAPEMISKYDGIVGLLEEKLKTNGCNKKKNKKKQINGIENEHKQIIDENSIVESTNIISKKKKKKMSLENIEINTNPVEKSENQQSPANLIENNSPKTSTKKLKKKNKKSNSVKCEKVDDFVNKSIKDKNVIIKKKSKKVKNDMPVNKNEIQLIEVEVKKGNIDENPFELDNSWNDEPDPKETLNVFCSVKKNDTKEKGKKKQNNKEELNQVDTEQKEEENSEDKIEEKSVILSKNAKRNLRKKNKKKQHKLEKKLLTEENDKEKLIKNEENNKQELNKNEETKNNNQSEQTQNNITSKRKSNKENNNNISPKNKKIKKNNKIENNKEVIQKKFPISDIEKEHKHSKPNTEKQHVTIDKSRKNKKIKEDNTIENNKEAKKIDGKRKFPISDVEKEHKRRKPDIEKQHVIIDGQEEEVVRYDGFPIKISDANRLHDLRKQLISKGIPRNEITRVLKLERRKAEKNLTRDRKKVCFHCRKSGHLLSDCPEVGTENMETCNSGICFKCGSTEHTHFNCKIVKGERFNYASCFICKEQGHIAKQCPDNPKGLYPQGGACKLCGDVTHFKKDCPQNMQQKENNAITVKTFSSNDLEGLDDDNPKPVQKSVVQKNKLKVRLVSQISDDSFADKF